MEHMTAEEMKTPLAEAFLENPNLTADLDKLLAKTEELFMDSGDTLDAMLMIRDATTYLAAKMRECRMNNDAYVTETRERKQKELAEGKEK
jgi:hypothetical protein